MRQRRDAIQPANVPIYEGGGTIQGSITPTALRELAVTLERLAAWHASKGGTDVDAPCLRRIESSGPDVIAHVSTGPAVGGSWLRLSMGPYGWRMEEV